MCFSEIECIWNSLVMAGDCVIFIPQDVATGMIANQVVITDRSQDMTMIRCDILNSPPDVNDDCAVDSSLTVLAFGMLHLHTYHYVSPVATFSYCLHVAKNI